MFPVELLAGRLGDDERRLRAAGGWMSGLDPRLLAWDTGLDPVENLHGTATDDEAHTWEVLSGTWQRMGGNIERTDGTGNDAAVIDVGVQDVTVSADLYISHNTGTREIGVVLRAVPDAWLVVVPRTADQRLGFELYIGKVVGGQRTNLATVSMPATLTGLPLRFCRLGVTATADQIHVTINGFPLTRYDLTLEDQAVFTGTKHGLGVQNFAGTGSWRNLAIWGVV